MAHIANCAAEALRRPVAFALGLAIPVLTSIIFTSGPGIASHIPNRLIDTFSQQAVVSTLQDTFGGDLSWRFTADAARWSSIVTLTAIAPPVSALQTAHEPDPRITLSGSISGPLARMVPIPIAIENISRLDRRVMILVTNVPEYAALSAGKPLGTGTWVVPASQAADLTIISYTLPSAGQHLTFELTVDGRVLSTAHAELDLT